jgi:alpha-beta hydrolase superfamily lysophospholipase
MFSADLNWYTTYGALEEAGYRVLAVDHRGHGRGIRTA